MYTNASSQCVPTRTGGSGRCTGARENIAPVSRAWSCCVQRETKGVADESLLLFLLSFIHSFIFFPLCLFFLCFCLSSFHLSSFVCFPHYASFSVPCLPVCQYPHPVFFFSLFILSLSFLSVITHASSLSTFFTHIFLAFVFL